MKTTPLLLTAVCIVLLPSILGHCADDLPPRYAGFIWKISGRAYLRTNEAAAPEALDEVSTRCRRLYTTTQLRCDDKASVEIRLRYGTATNISSKSWTLVPLEPPPIETTRRSGEWIANALVPGSISRASETPLIFFQPAPDGRIRLGQQAQFRWTPGPETELLQIEVTTEENTQKPFHTKVSASLGTFDSPQWRAFLNAARRSTEPLKLSLAHRRASGGVETRQSFELMSQEQERAAAMELDRISHECEPAVAPLARIGFFLDVRLKNEAAEEYAKALQLPLFQQSPDFVRAAASWFREIGDSRAAEQAEQRLSVGR